MNIFQKKVSGFGRRLKCLPYGLFYFRNSDFKISDSLLINGRRIEFRFNNLSIDEFTSICIDDCYLLGYLKRKFKNINTIVDVGANQGMFLIAARQQFPHATITAYEPNKLLENYLGFNASQLCANVYYEAVMKNDCKVSLHYADSDLATTSVISEAGTVRGTSLQKLVERAEYVDILKMDCEGAEWEILKAGDAWKKIRCLALEYHLGEIENGKIENLFQRIRAINFKVLDHNILNLHQGIIVAINCSV